MIGPAARQVAKDIPPGGGVGKSGALTSRALYATPSRLHSPRGTTPGLKKEKVPGGSSEGRMLSNRSPVHY